MRNKARLLALAKALPVALMMSGPSTQAFSFELNASTTIGEIGSSLSQGHLHAAQELLQQLHACDVHSLEIGDTIVPLSALGLALTALARGDDSLWLELEDVMQSANEGARSLFITDVGPIAMCQVIEEQEDTFVPSPPRAT